MKKIFYLFVLLSLFSCDKDETIQKELEFHEIVEGYYELRVAKTDVPIDLNHDGVSHTDLYKEVVHCSYSLDNLNLYSCVFVNKTSPSQVNFNVPLTERVAVGGGLSPCIRLTKLNFHYEIDPTKREVKLITCDDCDAAAANHHVEVLDLVWENDRAYFTLRQRFITSSGEKKLVMLYLEYEKVFEEYY